MLHFRKYPKRGFTSMNKTLSEQKVLKKLGIDNFRQMTKEKVVSFVSMIPQMDPEVAKKAIEQFPEYAQMALEMVKTYKSTIDKMLEANSKDTQSFYDACNSILESLQQQLSRDNISREERDNLNEKMLIVAQMISEKVSENKEFWLKILGDFGMVIIGLAGVASAVLGINKLVRKDL